MRKREIIRIEEKRELIKLKSIFFSLLDRYYERLGTWDKVASKFEKQERVIHRWRRTRSISKTTLMKYVAVLAQEFNKTGLYSMLQKKEKENKQGK